MPTGKWAIDESKTNWNNKRLVLIHFQFIYEPNNFFRRAIQKDFRTWLIFVTPNCVKNESVSDIIGPLDK